jgi:hypothetical protein
LLLFGVKILQAPDGSADPFRRLESSNRMVRAMQIPLGQKGIVFIAVP